jgi:hypothetical protein
MVEIAPLPPDFPPATDLDIPVRRPLEGGGFADISRNALKRFEAEQQWLRRPIVHPAEHARQQEAEAAAREIAARGMPDSRLVLRDRHAEHAEAVAEVVRLEALARQASDLVGELTQRHLEATAAMHAGEREAADKLVEAIAAGVGRDAYQLSPRVDQAKDRAAELAGKLRTAEQAKARFAAELATAKRQEAAARRLRDLGALQVMTNAASDLAGAIHRDEALLEQRRKNLITLRSLLDREQRRLGGYGQLAIQGPPVLAMPEAVAPDTDWSGILVRLIADPEAALP